MIEKVPFRRYKLEEEKVLEKDRVITVRLNPDEQTWLEELKADLHIDNDSRALKIAALAGKNVIQTTFGRPILSYLTASSRRRLEQENTQPNQKK